MRAPLPPLPGPAHLCLECRSRPILRGYAIPLCESCRAEAIRQPMPPLFRWLARAVLVLFLIGALRLPRELTADVWVVRGDAAFEKHRYERATAYYKKAERIYPDASLIQDRLHDVEQDRMNPGSVDRKKIEESLKLWKQI